MNIPPYADSTRQVVHLHDPGPDCAELTATILADRAAAALGGSADLSAGYRAELMRAAADGDVGRALDALTEWAARETRK